mmetsp:Transcript_52303/g.152010  ORF Transcript_52303/g.152010 Transcript_52303/m.152010 type:complete len:234 (-) Transcript_52303:299-1000(-)
MGRSMLSASPSAEPWPQCPTSGSSGRGSKVSALSGESSGECSKKVRQAGGQSEKNLESRPLANRKVGPSPATTAQLTQSRCHLSLRRGTAPQSASWQTVSSAGSRRPRRSRCAAKPPSAWRLRQKSSMKARTMPNPSSVCAPFCALALSCPGPQFRRRKPASKLQGRPEPLHGGAAKASPLPALQRPPAAAETRRLQGPPAPPLSPGSHSSRAPLASVSKEVPRRVGQAGGCR